MLVCLTPIRNEEWILERFLRCASLWADAVVVLDQCSTDRSPKIARSFEKVTYVRYEDPTFSEVERQRILVATARKLGPDNVLIALDADEILSANFEASAEFQALATLPRGTAIHAQRVNFGPELRLCWADPELPPFGVVDDGRDHQGRIIHTARVPFEKGAPVHQLCDVKVLHLQHIDPRRVRSKHRWYQCWERVNFPEKPAHVIYRTYHHADFIDPRRFVSINPVWIDAYRSRGIDLGFLAADMPLWWDTEVERMVATYGERAFRQIDIWDEVQELGIRHRDPRSYVDNLVFQYLRASQRFSRSVAVRLVDRLLSLFGW